MPTTRVFAPGAFAWHNRGDFALVHALRDWLGDNLGPTSITLTSSQPLVDAPHWGMPVLPMITRPERPINLRTTRWSGRVPPLGTLREQAVPAYIRSVCAGLERWAALYQRDRRVARRLVPAHVTAIADAISDADIVVAVPGGYLLAPKATDNWWLFHVPTFALASYLGKPPILSPCSIGPFHDSHKDLARWALGFTQFMFLRETYSEGYVRELAVAEDRFAVCPDLAFRFRAEGPRAAGAAALRQLSEFAAGRPLVGVSVRNHHFPGAADPAREEDKYLATVATATRRLIDEQGAAAVVVAQSAADGLVSADLVERIDRPGQALRLSDDALSPSDLQHVYARLRLLVGTRMHANILAMGAGTPVVGIAYEPKTTGIMEQLGLGQWVRQIDDLADLDALTQSRWADADAARSDVERRVAHARDELARAGALLRERRAQPTEPVAA
jgi:polysaccharide pyruvyl transferase WcaK-like protein